MTGKDTQQTFSLTSAILPERHGPVLLRQIRRFETVLVLEPGHDLVAAAQVGTARQQDEHGGHHHQRQTILRRHVDAEQLDRSGGRRVCGTTCSRRLSIVCKYVCRSQTGEFRNCCSRVSITTVSSAELYRWHNNVVVIIITTTDFGGPTVTRWRFYGSIIIIITIISTLISNGYNIITIIITK